MNIYASEWQRHRRLQRTNTGLLVLAILGIVWTGFQPRFEPSQAPQEAVTVSEPAPEPQIVAPQAPEQPQEPQTAGERISATVYAYNSTEAQTDGNPTIMASGKEVYLGAIACPSRYAFGTTVYLLLGQTVEGYTCEDRMAPRYRDGNYFDIWMPYEKDAKEWGVKTVNAIIFE